MGLGCSDRRQTGPQTGHAHAVLGGRPQAYGQGPRATLAVRVVGGPGPSHRSGVSGNPPVDHPHQTLHFSPPRGGTDRVDRGARAPSDAACGGPDSTARSGSRLRPSTDQRAPSSSPTRAHGSSHARVRIRTGTLAVFHRTRPFPHGLNPPLGPRYPHAYGQGPRARRASHAPALASSSLGPPCGLRYRSSARLYRSSADDRQAGCAVLSFVSVRPIGSGTTAPRGRNTP